MWNWKVPLMFQARFFMEPSMLKNVYFIVQVCIHNFVCSICIHTFHEQIMIHFCTKIYEKTDPHAKKNMMTYDSILWKSMATVNCLVTNILQNIFCVQQKTETHTGLEQLQGEQIFICGWTIPFKWLKYCSIGALHARYCSLSLFFFFWEAI